MAQLSEGQLKDVAIKLCTVRGIDPYEKVRYNDGSNNLVLRFQPRWKHMANQVNMYYDRLLFETQIKSCVNWILNHPEEANGN